MIFTYESESLTVALEVNCHLHLTDDEGVVTHQGYLIAGEIRFINKEKSKAYLFVMERHTKRGNIQIRSELPISIENNRIVIVRPMLSPDVFSELERRRFDKKMAESLNVVFSMFLTAESF